MPWSSTSDKAASGDGLAGAAVAGSDDAVLVAVPVCVIVAVPVFVRDAVASKTIASGVASNADDDDADGEDDEDARADGEADRDAGADALASADAEAVALALAPITAAAPPDTTRESSHAGAPAAPAAARRPDGLVSSGGPSPHDTTRGGVSTPAARVAVAVAVAEDVPVALLELLDDALAVDDVDGDAVGGGVGAPESVADGVAGVDEGEREPADEADADGDDDGERECVGDGDTDGEDEREPAVVCDADADADGVGVVGELEGEDDDVAELAARAGDCEGDAELALLADADDKVNNTDACAVGVPDALGDAELTVEVDV